MKIFIGSSSHYVTFSDDKSIIDQEKTKSSSTLYPIINFLRKEGHNVQPWWEPEVISAGEDLLDSLIAKAHSCDGAIFVLRPDDLLNAESETVVKGKGVPRGNVLIECGMFYGAKGRTRTLVLKDGDFDSIKIPNDIIGNKLEDLKNTSITTEVKKFFDNKKLSAENEKVTFYFNTDSVQEIIDKKYGNWGTKSLYIGSESARKWKAIEQAENYLIDTTEVTNFVSEIHSNSTFKINFKEIDNVISLGPGCGKFDDEIVSEVYKVNNFINYVPIDINPYLAFEASRYIKKRNQKIRVPSAIVDDFETNADYVSEILKRKFHELNQSNLFVMLGGTFSNLEGQEKNIARNIDNWMGEKDYLIIDAFIKVNEYDFELDTKRHVANLPKPYKDLIANAVIKRHLLLSDDLDFIDSVGKDLALFLKGSEVINKKPYTNIDKTSVVTYKLRFDKTKDYQHDILIAKRYSFDELLKFLESNFKLIHSFNGLKDGSINKSDRGVFLLQKK
ncbi:MAG: L-histidine N(alpha)-methyltransferase [Saprospiraceae bacterium]